MSIRIDSHQQFWDSSAPGRPGDSRLPSDLEPLMSANHMHYSVAVQSRGELAETHWLLELSRRHEFIRGVVGWFDLTNNNLESELDALRWPNRLVGVRPPLSEEADDEYMLRPEFRHGLKVIGESGLACDLLIQPRHFAAALKLVREFPGIRFILDHLGGPPVATGELHPWMEDIRALAHEPNVACKLSGLAGEAGKASFAATARPYLEIVTEAFGERRLLFGSDWPACERASSYGQVVAMVEDHIAHLPQESREWIFGGNASRWYGLGFESEERYPFARMG